MGSIRKEIYSLGTICSIYIDCENEDLIIEDLIEKIYSLESDISYYIVGSDIDNINKMAGTSFVKVKRETIELLKRAKIYSKLSNGKFDITIAPSVDLWDVLSNSKDLPDKSNIDKTIKLVNIEDINIIEDERLVKLNKFNQKINLGAVGKGFIADNLIEVLKEKNVSKYIIDLGGQISIFSKEDYSDINNVGIQDPFGERFSYVGILNVNDVTISTSGIYERYNKTHGETINHIINPITGAPIKSDIVSVTVIHEKAEIADAISTALIVCELKGMMEIINKIVNMDVIVITKDKKIYITDNLKDKFIITNNEYSINVLNKILEGIW